MERIQIIPSGKKCTQCKTGPALCLHEDGRHLCPQCEAKSPAR